MCGVFQIILPVAWPGNSYSVLNISKVGSVGVEIITAAHERAVKT